MSNNIQSAVGNRRAHEQRSAAAFLYYSDHKSFIAVSSFETFRNSWAGQQWMRKNKLRIEAFISEQAVRFQQRWTV